MGEAHAGAAEIFETPRKSLFSDWPGEFRATADPCYDLHCSASQAAAVCARPKRALHWVVGRQKCTANPSRAFCSHRRRRKHHFLTSSQSCSAVPQCIVFCSDVYCNAHYSAAICKNACILNYFILITAVLKNKQYPCISQVRHVQTFVSERT